jgi:hypothetical protein
VLGKRRLQKCNQIEAATKAALDNGMDAIIDHVTDFAQLCYGVNDYSCPVVDGKVVFNIASSKN